MGINAGIFGDDLNYHQRFIADEQALMGVNERLRQQGLVRVLTMGSFDMLHIGHCRYLHQAKKLGDVLIVGVETDAKVRGRKGELRPVVPQHERFEMLAHTRYVDILTPKDEKQPKWHLIKLIRPDVLQAVEGTYTDEELEALRPFCGRIVVQPRQAETSTSAKIRILVISGMHDLAERLATALPEVVVGFFTEKLGEITGQLRLVIPECVNNVVSELKGKANAN